MKFATTIALFALVSAVAANNDDKYDKPKVPCTTTAPPAKPSDYEESKSPVRTPVETPVETTKAPCTKSPKPTGGYGSGPAATSASSEPGTNAQYLTASANTAQWSSAAGVGAAVLAALALF